MTKLDELKAVLLALETPGQAQSIMDKKKHAAHIGGVASSVHEALTKHHQGDYKGAADSMATAGKHLADAAPLHSGLTPGQRPESEAQWSDLFNQAWGAAKHKEKGWTAGVSPDTHDTMEEDYFKPKQKVTTGE